MTDTSRMLMTWGDFQCEQTNCMGHKAGSFRMDFRTPKIKEFHSSIKKCVNLKGKTFSFWIKDTGKHSNQTWEVCSVGAIITKMHPAFNHTISLCKCNEVTGSLWECCCWSCDSASVILDTVLARLAFLVVQLLCSFYTCFDCLRLLDWFHPCLVNLSFLVYSILFLCQFLVLLPEFSMAISPQVFPALLVTLDRDPPTNSPTRLFLLFRFVFLLWLISVLTSIHPLSPPPNHCLFQ